MPQALAALGPLLASVGSGIASGASYLGSGLLQAIGAGGTGAAASAVPAIGASGFDAASAAAPLLAAAGPAPAAWGAAAPSAIGASSGLSDALTSFGKGFLGLYEPSGSQPLVAGPKPDDFWSKFNDFLGGAGMATQNALVGALGDQASIQPPRVQGAVIGGGGGGGGGMAPLQNPGASLLASLIARGR